MCAYPSQGASSSGLTAERASSRGFSGDPYGQRSGERCSQKQKMLLGSSRRNEVGSGDNWYYEKDLNDEQGATDWDWDDLNDDEDSQQNAASAHNADTHGGGGPSPPQPRPLTPPHRHRRIPAHSPPCHRRRRAPQQLRGFLVDIIAKTTTRIRRWPSPQPRLSARNGHAISPLPRMALIAPPLVLYTAVIAVTVMYLRIAFIRSCKKPWINFSSREER